MICEHLIETPRGAFGVRSIGADNAPVVVLLHGFPDDASTFDLISKQLAARGWRCVAPYLRGYWPSPLDGDLGFSGLADDLAAISLSLSPHAPVAFIGHDYGAQIGYLAMTRYPDLFSRAVTIAGVHPAIINRNLRRHPKQWWMSRYIIFFQFGTIADRRVANDNFAYVDKLWQRWSPAFKIPDAHLFKVKNTLRRSMPGPVAMYRAGDFDLQATPCRVSTLFIAGACDGCMLPQIAAGQEILFPTGYQTALIDRVGHFPHLEVPERVTEMVASWFEE
jgi:pimeloyl-ACP methyl ester carboxylesterase